jgi:D-methionine transport system substrate-binding protein
MQLKKILAVALAIAALGTTVLFAKCSGAAAKTVKVGLVGDEIRHAWEEAVKLAAKEGVKVELVNFGDYAVPNRALNDGDIDLNSFQHDAFLQDEIKNHNYKIVAVGNTVIYFLGIYSNKIRNVSDLQDGDSIIVPNDATNGGRALKVLEAAGIFTLDPSKGNTPTPRDITSNPKNIKIVEVDAAQAYRNLDDPKITAVVSNATFVTDAGGDPNAAIYIKPIDPVSDKPYINIIVARIADKDDAVIKKVIAAFQSPEVRKVIETQKPSTGVALPAW